jgi:hypothetical protein
VFLRNPKKTSGFEKLGFQNHKAAANMGFCASGAGRKDNRLESKAGLRSRLEVINWAFGKTMGFLL